MELQMFIQTLLLLVIAGGIVSVASDVASIIRSMKEENYENQSSNQG